MTNKVSHKNALLLMSGCILATRLIALALFHTFDDAFITYRYGCNLANGNGFIYNIGEQVLGTTAPLHGLINAALCALPLPLTTLNGLINSVLDVGTFILLAKAWTHDETRTQFALIFGAIWAAVPSFARISVGGMETSWFLFSIALTLWLYESDRPKWAIAVAAASYFFRPEAVILVGLLGLYELIRGRWLNALTMGGIAGAVAGLPLLLIRAQYGSFFSQSVTSKQNLNARPLTDTLSRFFMEDPTTLILGILGIVGLAILFTDRKHKLLWLIAGWTLLYGGAYLIRRPLVWPWYGAPLYIGLAVLTAALLVWLTSRLTSKSENGWLNRLIFIGAWVAPLLLWGALWAVQGKTTIEQNVYAPLEAWCDSIAGRPTTILADDIGAVGFYCMDGHITDPAGLVTTDIQIYSERNRLVEESTADYLFLVTRIGTKNTVQFDRYTPIQLFGDRQVDDLLNFNYDVPIWKQEYMLFEKK